MKKQLRVVLLIGAMCLLGTTAALAYQEAPMLQVKVAAGELPPVEERLPEEPPVMEPLEEIGQYGGTAHVFILDPGPWGDLQEEPERGHYFLRLTQEGEIVPDLAKGYKLSDDAKNFTLYLRKGLKWSDGAPFTADDIVFMFEDMHWNDKVQTWGSGINVKGIEKIDDYTVRFEWDVPYPVIVTEMMTSRGSSWFMFQPKHYLERWHIKYNPKANELAKKEGFDNWWEAFYYHCWWAPQKDLDKPTLQPWIPKKFTTTTKVFERNPYYWRVDEAGNQLPYIDEIISTIVDIEVYHMKIIEGEADVAFAQTTFENYSLYRENEEEGNYRVVEIPGIMGSELVLGVNMNHSDPALRKIYQNVKFRQALSLAINRQEINETVYFGLAVPRQGTVLPDVSYYKPEWGEEHPYARYDPDEANRFLDEVGLTERDKDGFRIGPDGKAMVLLVEYTSAERIKPTSLMELVKEYWDAVGLKVLLKLEEMSLYAQRYSALDHDIMAEYLPSGTEIKFYGSPTGEMWDPASGGLGWGVSWGLWLDAKKDIERGIKTLKDFEGGKLPGEEPPEEIKKLREWLELRKQTKYRSEEYLELNEKIFDFHAKNLFFIGTVGMAPDLYIAKKNMGNIPSSYKPTMEVSLNFNEYADQLFFKQ